MNREIATKTLAQLYLRQGNPQKALEIYLNILKQEPANAEIRAAIKNLKRKMAESPQIGSIDHCQEPSRMEKIKNLEKWREKIRMIREERESREKD